MISFNSDYSLIYSNIWVYRFVMNVLYLGGYSARFKDLISCAKFKSNNDEQILELCFGDIYIARWAQRAGIKYTGIDVNEVFVLYAASQGIDARQEDLHKISKLPDTSVTVMMGSLYHFHNDLKAFVDKIMASSPRFIISEPVRNLSSHKGFIGWIARRSTKAGRGNESFRYDELVLIDSLARVCGERYTIQVLKRGKKDIIIELKWK